MTDGDSGAGHPTAPPTSAPGFDPEVDAALRRLPIEQRAVIALHYAADLSLVEVADALKVPVGTAKSRLAAALERLRRDLGRTSVTDDRDDLDRRLRDHFAAVAEPLPRAVVAAARARLKPRPGPRLGGLVAAASLAALAWWWWWRSGPQPRTLTRRPRR